MGDTVFAPRVASRLGASPSDKFAVIGEADLLAQREFHFSAGYPGADKWVMAEPQTVPLESNGYYVRARFEGVVTRRGYYGGDLGGTEEYWMTMYGYEADWLLTQHEHVKFCTEHGPCECCSHCPAAGDTGDRTRANYGPWLRLRLTDTAKEND